MSLEPISAYESYSAAWGETNDSAARKRFLERAWADDGAFFDEETPDGLVGREALSDYIAATHEEMPELVITETSQPQMLGGRLRVRWTAEQGGVHMYTGTDFLEFNVDGRISRLTMFYDSTPE
jgi:hypothetical protein